MIYSKVWIGRRTFDNYWYIWDPENPSWLEVISDPDFVLDGLVIEMRGSEGWPGGWYHYQPYVYICKSHQVFIANAGEDSPSTFVISDEVLGDEKEEVLAEIKKFFQRKRPDHR